MNFTDDCKLAVVKFLDQHPNNKFEYKKIVEEVEKNGYSIGVLKFLWMARRPLSKRIWKFSVENMPNSGRTVSIGQR